MQLSMERRLNLLLSSLVELSTMELNGTMELNRTMESQSQTGRRGAELSPSVTAHRAQVVSTYNNIENGLYLQNLQRNKSFINLILDLHIEHR